MGALGESNVVKIWVVSIMGQFRLSVSEDIAPIFEVGNESIVKQR